MGWVMAHLSFMILRAALLCVAVVQSGEAWGASLPVVTAD